jgi:septum formation protein
MNKLILASASQRRKELLQQIGVYFSCMPMDIDETSLAGENAESYVLRLAEQKALAALPKSNGLPVLGSDTCVVLDEEIMGKPENEQDAINMLKRLSGRSHVVKTAVAVCCETKSKVQLCSEVVETEVSFAELSDSQILSYVKSGEPMDKAGAYGIQGRAAVFVNSINGSYSNVVGLPLAQTAQILDKMGIEVWQY